MKSTITVASMIMIMTLEFTAVHGAVDSLVESGDRVGIYPLSKTVRIGKEITMLIALPKKGKDYSEWSLYFAGTNNPLAKGKLGETDIIHMVKTLMTTEGTHSAILTIYSQTGELTGIRTAEVKVILAVKPIMQWLRSISGFLAGAFIAVVTFLIQDYVRNRNKSENERRELSSRISFVLTEFAEWDGNGELLPLPPWLIDPNQPNWSVRTQEEPFRSIISELINARRNAHAGTLNLEGFRQRLTDVISRLPYQFSSDDMA